MTYHSQVLKRVREEALYIIENKTSMRAAATAFGVTASTLKRDITLVLKREFPDLYLKVQEILNLKASD